MYRAIVTTEIYLKIYRCRDIKIIHFYVIIGDSFFKFSFLISSNSSWSFLVNIRKPVRSMYCTMFKRSLRYGVVTRYDLVVTRYDLLVSRYDLVVKASAHSFKHFTSRLLKLYFSFSMRLSPRMNVMLHFIWTLPVQLRGTSEHYKKILSTVGFEPPTPQGLQITSPPLSQLGHNSLDMRWN